jgi:phosphotransferase system enzyme I (PtsI)
MPMGSAFTAVSSFLCRTGSTPWKRISSAYKSVLEGMGDKPVTIRTMDLGGDKLSPELIGSGEANPILGWRAIRYCLG